MQRRAFLKVVTATLQGAIGLMIALPAVRYLLTPLRRKRKEAGFHRVAPLSAIRSETPLRVPVLADRWDAYTHHPPGPIGSVWLCPKGNPRDDGDDAVGPGIRCLQTTCPHLGCGVDYVKDRDVFSCPCHASEFDRRGKRISGPSPRDMDELECRVTDADERGMRWVEVRYQEFQTGVTEKLPIADRGSGIGDRDVEQLATDNRHSAFGNRQCV